MTQKAIFLNIPRTSAISLKTTKFLEIHIKTPYFEQTYIVITVYNLLVHLVLVFVPEWRVTSQQNVQYHTCNCTCCTLYMSIHCTLYMSIHCKLYMSIHCTLYMSIHCTLHILHHTLHCSAVLKEPESCINIR